MLTIKGFNIFKDLNIFTGSLHKLSKWNKIVRKLGFNNVITGLETLSFRKFPDAELSAELIKYHRVLYFFLKRILRHKNPCTIASLCLFDICMENKVSCRLVVGADMINGDIVGHSWVETGGIPINENPESLNKYSRMIEV